MRISPFSPQCFLVMAFALTLPSPSSAWEHDVHFGLTRWLAIAAGFTPLEADDIAAAAQLPDDSVVLGPIQATVMSCALKDEAVSHTVHDTHFPSPKSVRRPPSERGVKPGEAWNRYQRNSAPTVVKTRADRADLGGFLHGFQDSWSHGGEPDVPPARICDSDYAWGHPLNRGGWTCHLADVTYYWEDHTAAMAMATFEILAAAAGKGRTWSKPLDDAVRDFARRQDKRAKREWFMKEKFSSADFVNDTSLPECIPAAQCKPESIVSKVERWTRLRLGLAADPESVPVLKQIQGFIAAMQNSDIDITTLIDATAAAAALRNTLNVTEDCPNLVPVYARLMLQDGFQNGFGARQPLAMCELALKNLKRGPVSCADAIAAAEAEMKSRLRYGPTLSEIIERLGRIPFYRGTVSRHEGQYRAILEFAHIPDDVLILTATDKAITSFTWAPKR